MCIGEYISAHGDVNRQLDAGHILHEEAFLFWQVAGDKFASTCLTQQGCMRNQHPMTDQTVYSYIYHYSDEVHVSHIALLSHGAHL